MRVAGQDEDVEDVNESTEEEQQDELEGEGESQAEGEESGEDEGEGEDEEVVVQIGSEEPAASEEAKVAPQWVKDLRAEQKKLRRENAELKAKLGTGQPAVQGKPALPPKPKLADFDFDEEKYEQARDEWDATKRAVDAWEQDQANRVKAAQEAARSVNDAYARSRAALKVKDFDDAEEHVVAEMNEVQQAILKAGASNPGAMVYALGKNHEKRRELASIKDPVKFAVAVGALQTEIKVTKRTSTKPAPESTVRSGSGSAPPTSATLQRLEAEAERTGDRTKVVAYRRQLKQQAK
jgi:hypothetical protein